eukprot:SAG31_NODE_4578_length_3122_cov_1.428713_2_plen_118_part_00
MPETRAVVGDGRAHHRDLVEPGFALARLERGHQLRRHPQRGRPQAELHGVAALRHLRDRIGVVLGGGDELGQAEPRLGADVPGGLAGRRLPRPHLRTRSAKGDKGGRVGGSVRDGSS